MTVCCAIVGDEVVEDETAGNRPNAAGLILVELIVDEEEA
jgi:hypothetical protein